jgi:hypothetical protein
MKMPSHQGEMIVKNAAACGGVGAVVLSVCASAMAQAPAGLPRYTVVDLGMTEGTASAFIQSVGINNANQVLGYAFGSAGNEVVVRQLGGPSYRYASPDPINRSITPTAIDQAGNVTGYYTPNLVNQPFFIPAGTPSLTGFADIVGPFPGTSDNAQRFDNALAISNNGQHIVGQGGNVNSNLAGWYRSGSGPVTTLPASGFANVTATGVNNSGMVVGYGNNGQYRAMRWATPGSEPTALTDLGGGLARAYAVNDAGWAAGESYVPALNFINHAVVWDPAGNVVDIHAASGFATGISRAVDINSSGWVVANGSQRFLWAPGIGGASILNLITNFGTMASLGNITGINDMGYISAHGNDSNGRAHLYILVPDRPVPTPGAAAVLALGGLVACRRRRG